MTILFSDNFESGDLSHSENGVSWLNGKNTAVVSGLSHSGNYALRFFFEGSLDQGADAHAEQRFDLGSEIRDIYIRYYIYFPSNYEHRNVSPNNNKLIRIWSNNADYTGDEVKVGASFYRGNLSDNSPEGRKEGYGEDLIWDYHGSAGPLFNADWAGQWNLSPSDLGRWICFEWHFKPDLADGNGGAFEFWVDGVKQWGASGISVANAPPVRDFFKTGYLMGWANSGFNEDTYIYIDDIVMADSYIGPAMNTTPSPTTIAPTTAEPTTLAPTTLAPTTVGPTTIEPTTVAPTTSPPTTLVPTTLAPTTTSPTTVGPTTVLPTTLAPTTLLTTLAPTTAAPPEKCIKIFNSTINIYLNKTSKINDVANLESIISKELNLNGHLCR